MLTMLHDKVISFQGSLLGFDKINQFRVSVVEDNPIYAYLQSEEDEYISFLVVNPFIFYPDYSIELDENIKERLEIRSHEEVVVVGIVTIHNPFIQSTVNLLAPLVINIENGKGQQLVLPPKSSYATKEPLFKKQLEKAGSNHVDFN